MSWSWFVVTVKRWRDFSRWERYHSVRWSESQTGLSKSSVCQWRHLLVWRPDLSSRCQSSQRNLRKSHLTTVERQNCDFSDSSDQLLTGMRSSPYLWQRRSHSQRQTTELEERIVGTVTGWEERRWRRRWGRKEVERRNRRRDEESPDRNDQKEESWNAQWKWKIINISCEDQFNQQVRKCWSHIWNIWPIHFL